MSPASIIVLSETAQVEELNTAIQQAPAGERLLVLPTHLQRFAAPEPALNISQPDAALRLQLIDNAISALRPHTIIADLPSLEHITPNLGRYPQLRAAIILCRRKENRKRLKDQAAAFGSCEIFEI